MLVVAWVCPRSFAFLGKLKKYGYLAENQPFSLGHAAHTHDIEWPTLDLNFQSQVQK